jgi:hypothetical protein
MHAIGAGRERHVQTLVDDHTRARTADSLAAALHEAQEWTAIEVALANLNQVHARLRRRADVRDEVVFG